MRNHLKQFSLKLIKYKEVVFPWHICFILLFSWVVFINWQMVFVHRWSFVRSWKPIIEGKNPRFWTAGHPMSSGHLDSDDWMDWSGPFLFHTLIICPKSLYLLLLCSLGYSQNLRLQQHMLHCQTRKSYAWTYWNVARGKVSLLDPFNTCKNCI